MTLAAKCPSDVIQKEDLTLGEMLCNIKNQAFMGIYKLIGVSSYVAGIFMLVTAVFKLKQVKDNPTQIPVTAPMALFVVATLLLFLPSMFDPLGRTIFGSEADVQTGEEALGSNSDVHIKNLLDDSNNPGG